MQGGMARPTGVTILAVLAAIFGIFGVLAGIGFVFGGGLLATVSGAAGGLVTILGLIILAVSIAELALAYGFWTLKPWAWTWGVVLQVVGVVISILEVPLLNVSITNVIIPVVVAAVIVYYLNTPVVRRAFSAPEKGWPFIGG